MNISLSFIPEIKTNLNRILTCVMMLKAQAIPTWPTPTMVTLLPEWATGTWISVLSFSTLVVIFSIVYNSNKQSNWQSNNTIQAHVRQRCNHNQDWCNSPAFLTMSLLVSNGCTCVAAVWQQCKKRIARKINLGAHVNTNARSRVTFMNVKLKSPRARLARPPFN